MNGAADRAGPIRLLTFSTLFPDRERPNHGVFVENRLRHLVGTGQAVSTVLAPTPWFPWTAERFGAWGRLARVPAAEVRHGIAVQHPRYPVIPRLGMAVAPLLLFLASRRALARMMREGFAFDLIDAHYLYPDGVAAVWLGRAFGKPVTITARGSDVTQLPDFAVPRALIRRAMAGADALIGVSAALCARMVELGAAPSKVTTLRNGVDIGLFRPPEDRAALRASLGLARPTLISVGLLIPRKQHHLTIAAMAGLPEFELLIAGEGPERGRLEALIGELGLADRVRLLGPRPHAELPALYGAADAMVLASSREGWANVLLESMACGTPVVASNIAGNPEVVQEEAAGLIVDETTPGGIAAGVRRLFAAPPARVATRAYAERFGWGETSAGQLAVFRRVLAARMPAGGLDEDAMNRETSIGLDLVRVVAALLVFLSHAGWQRSSGGLLWQFQQFGPDAVDVFFVLSGFVIAFVVDGRETSALAYATHRAARLYSVALPALAATFALDALGRSVRPELYVGWCCDIAGSEAWQFLGSAVFLNEIWSHHTPPGSDVPYWSLGFEVVYYLAFGVAWFVRRPWNLPAAALVLVLAGPGIAVLFPLWLAGAAAYWVCARRTPGMVAGWVLLVGGLTGLVANALFRQRHGDIFDAFALTPVRLHDYAQDYIVGLSFVAGLVGFRSVSEAFAGGFDRVVRPIRWLAGATFTLYLFHQPLIHVLVALSPWADTAWQTRIGIFVVVPLLALALAEVTERRKATWRQAFVALAGAVRPAPARH